MAGTRKGNYDNLAKSVEARRNATHCVNGHSEWGKRKDGRRYCIPCKHERQRIHRGLKSGRLKHDFGLYAIDIEVLRLGAIGYSITKTAQELHYSFGGIQVIRKRAKHKLGTDDFFQAIEIAKQKGVIG